jgi:hypothetical protein
MRQARHRQSQVCGVHGQGLSGFGQQVQVWLLPNAEPGGMAISPGRRVFRPLTRCHRPWPGCRAPTNPPGGGHGQVGAASRFHRTPPSLGLAGTVAEQPVEGFSTFPMGGPKERLLLALLLTRPNQVVSVEALIEGLWGDRPPPTAAKTLQSHVMRVRRALEPGRGRGTLRTG